MNNSAKENIAAAKLGDLQETIKKKKISFFSAILLIISSCIGSGIFFKSASVLNLNSGSFILSIVSWVVSSIAVICMAIALIEVASKDKHNLSLIGWCKKFNNPFIYRCCLNFMVYIFMPLEYFYLPYYIIMSIQNMLKGFGLPYSFGTENDWAIWMVIGMCIASWFIFTSGINTKIADIQNKIILGLKFIPLASVVILGFVIIGYNGVNIDLAPTATVNPSDFYQVWPGIGTVLALSAIFFSFDGFYFAAGIQKEMKEPKKTPKAIIIGLLVVAFVYLLIAIVMTLASPSGGFSGDSEYDKFLSNNGLGWLFAVLNLLIAVSIMGTLNGFTVWATRLVEELVMEEKLPLSAKIKHKIHAHRPILGALYVYVLSMSVVVIFSIIGGLAYIPKDYLDSNMNSLYDSVGKFSSAKLFTFSNLMSNWASIFAFTFIVVAIGGCLHNRKTNKVEVEKNKYFKGTAIASIIMIGIPLITTLIQPFVNLALLENYDGANYNEEKISRIMLVIVLFMFLGLTIIPSFFKNRKC